MNRTAALSTALALAGALAGCKPPPTDSAVARVSLLDEPTGPSAPLASPDTTGGVWAGTANPLRIVYGVPGQPVLVSIECRDPASPAAQLRITRQAPADPGAAALLALIGNGRIGRFPVAATKIGAQSVWQGDVPALVAEWDALKPEREATVTVPGAGLVKLNPSPLPMALIEACRGPQPTLDPVPAALPSGDPSAAR